jgi:hypothetical protein
VYKVLEKSSFTRPALVERAFNLHGVRLGDLVGTKP